jgi:sulfite exporter TauE/SafE/copper chaperone CopZ
MAKKTYYIQGMHCPACETLVERTVRTMKELNRVEVSLEQSRITIEAESGENIPSAHDLNRIFKKDGYTFSSSKQKKIQTPTNEEILFVGVVFILILALFFALNGSELLSGFQVDSSSGLPAYFLFGIAAGLSSCAALIGGLLLSVQESWLGNRATGEKASFLPFLLFNGSRIVAFGLLGGLLGILGQAIQFSFLASSILTLFIAILMVIIGMQMLGIGLFRKIRLNFTGRMISSVTTGNRYRGWLVPVIFGVITFFLPCGFTMITQAQALASGSFLRGLAISTAFALGTLPVLLLISYSSVKFYKNPKFSTSFRLLSGLLVIFFAVYTIRGQIKILQVPTSENENDSTANVVLPTPLAEIPSETQETLKPIRTEQVMKMEARGFEYFLETRTIQSGIPTRFEITNNGSVGCAQAVYARGLYTDVILLKPGLNIVEFTAPEKGTYQISCSMWMVKPVSIVVE